MFFNKKLLFIIYLSSSYNIHSKYVLGCRSAGLFSCVFDVINHLDWAEKNRQQLAIYWSKNYCLYYQKNGYNGSQNCWEYYFEPINKFKYFPGEKIFYAFYPPDNCCVVQAENPDKLERLRVNAIIKKYIKIKPNILKKIENFYNMGMLGKKTIGIHLRGTDKKIEVAPTDLNIIFDYANSFSGYQFLVATDEQYLLDMAKKKLHGRVIYYNSHRSTTGNPIHLMGGDRALKGEEVLIEAVLLSRCDKFLHTFSNVSTAVLFLNPELENVYFK